MEPRMMPSVLALLVAILSCLNFLTVDACTCAMSHPSEIFCKADYVIKAKVKTARLIKRDNNYTGPYPIRDRQFGVKISKVFKAAPGFEVGKFVRLLTSEHGSMCGVSMEVGEMYIITGYLNSPLNICNPPRKWLRLPVPMRKGYGYLYKKSCGCKVGLCGESGCGLEDKIPGYCMRKSSADQCYREFAVCLNDGQGICQWSTRALFNKCVREVETSENNTFEWEP